MCSSILKMDKKTQIQMGETIAVLFIFFILVLIGFIFYVNVVKNNIEVEREEIRQEEAIKVAQKALFLPELQCSDQNIDTNDCIDRLKLEVSGGEEGIINSNKMYYFDTFGFSRITVENIYPNKESWVLYDNSLDKFSSKITTHFPVVVYNSTSRHNSFGVMKVETFTK